MNRMSKFILDTVTKDIYDMPILHDKIVAILESDDYKIKIYRVHDDYEVMVVNRFANETLYSLYADMLNNIIKVENLELEYCRNIYLEVYGSYTKSNYYKVEYEKCVFTNPHNLSPRLNNCRNCHYLGNF